MVRAKPSPSSRPFGDFLSRVPQSGRLGRPKHQGRLQASWRLITLDSAMISPPPSTSLPPLLTVFFFFFCNVKDRESFVDEVMIPQPSWPGLSLPFPPYCAIVKKVFFSFLPQGLLEIVLYPTRPTFFSLEQRSAAITFFLPRPNFFPSAIFLTRKF